MQAFAGLNTIEATVHEKSDWIILFSSTLPVKREMKSNDLQRKSSGNLTVIVTTGYVSADLAGPAYASAAAMFWQTYEVNDLGGYRAIF